MTFERGLRAILRHDPDVVMIGEIRDLETARAAIQASLTGHLVFSTLHTNDVGVGADALDRHGRGTVLVSSTLIGSMAQRLVRKICSKCKVQVEPDHEKISPRISNSNRAKCFTAAKDASTAARPDSAGAADCMNC